MAELEDDTPSIPRSPKGFDHRDDPKDMDPEYLLKLSTELTGRVAIWSSCSKKLFDRAAELRAEILRRLKEREQLREIYLKS